jgi:hypothetical protein
MYSHVLSHRRKQFAYVRVQITICDFDLQKDVVMESVVIIGIAISE